METIWRDVPGFEGLYQASNQGEVRSKRQVLKERNHRNGSVVYKAVCFSVQGAVTNHYVHRAVWEAFNGPIPEGMQIGHLDEDPGNNKLENLMLCTPQENLAWGTHNERVKRANQGKTKDIVQYDMDGNVVKEWCSLHEIENALGFSRKMIKACCEKERPWKGNEYKGYKWKYKN